MTQQRTDAKARAWPRILVGVDESASSRAALRWAVGQSRVTGLPLLVVHAWRGSPYPYVDATLGREVAELRAQEILDSAVREATEATEAAGKGTSPDVTARLIRGHPARVLATLGQAATMVVIGAGGHGELAGLLLGSVGLHLVSHAPVPVVVVPCPPPAAAADGAVLEAVELGIPPALTPA